MKTILVLFGGCSTEYEVSLHSAYAVLSHMDPARYTPLAVGITREGQWLCYTGDLSRLEDGTWQQAADCIPCTPLVEREAHALLWSRRGSDRPHLTASGRPGLCRGLPGRGDCSAKGGHPGDDLDLRLYLPGGSSALDTMASDPDGGGY